MRFRSVNSILLSVLPLLMGGIPCRGESNQPGLISPPGSDNFSARHVCC